MLFKEDKRAIAKWLNGKMKAVNDSEFYKRTTYVSLRLNTLTGGK
jgi:hypothetical protein